MSAPKFTPRPWSYEPHGNTIALYSGRTPGQHGLRLMNLDDGDSNFEENASLIVAAPEMYEALKALYERYVMAIGNEGPEAMSARIALAKAEGRS